MQNVSGILKSQTYLSMLNGYVSGPPSSMPNKKASIFTAKHFLKYCRLLIGPTKPEKITGLSLVSIIANEPGFKEGIIRRCELPHRTKKTKNIERKHVKINIQKENKVIPKPILSEVPEEKSDSDVGPEIIPTKLNDSLASLQPMLVNDIKSFALLDAKFRENEERNCKNGTLNIWNEEFIRDINPTYSDEKIESCIIYKQPDKEVQQLVSKPISEILTVFKEEETTEVIMPPRPSSSRKKDVETNEAEVYEKKPVLSKLMLVKPGKAMFKQEKNSGWRIKESFQIYKAKQESFKSRASHCASEVAPYRHSDSYHPLVTAVTSTRLLANARNSSEESQRRRKDAEKRIRASFDAFVARQSLARLNRSHQED